MGASIPLIYVTEQPYYLVKNEEMLIKEFTTLQQHES
jgi:hypothetical protein